MIFREGSGPQPDRPLLNFLNVYFDIYACKDVKELMLRLNNMHCQIKAWAVGAAAQGPLPAEGTP